MYFLTRKKWILFPPEEDLKPTRVPYEESSVYSQLNLFSPNLRDFDCKCNSQLLLFFFNDTHKIFHF